MNNPDIQRILDFWFCDSELDSPQLDSRMDRWFSASDELDTQIQTEFGTLIEQATAGQLDQWTETPQGRLALILLLDQFCRNVYRGTADAYAHDKKALKIAIEGTMAGDHKQLNSFERMFFFMPLQHAESLKIQEKSVGIFNALAETVSGTLHETFLASAQFAELHRDIVAEFGRFPHRNVALGRPNTSEEDIYLARVDWAPDSSTVVFQRESRDQTRLDLMAADPATGKSRIVLTETSDVWINLHHNLKFLERSPGEFIWASERSGFQHLYRYDLSGKLLAQLTAGDWAVSKLHSVDENRGVVVFDGFADSPLEKHLY